MTDEPRVAPSMTALIRLVSALKREHAGGESPKRSIGVRLAVSGAERIIREAGIPLFEPDPRPKKDS